MAAVNLFSAFIVDILVRKGFISRAWTRNAVVTLVYLLVTFGYIITCLLLLTQQMLTDSSRGTFPLIVALSFTFSFAYAYHGQIFKLARGKRVLLTFSLIAIVYYQSM